jgi:hypothetical protein
MSGTSRSALNGMAPSRRSHRGGVELGSAGADASAGVFQVPPVQKVCYGPAADPGRAAIRRPEARAAHRDALRLLRLI